MATDPNFASRLALLPFDGSIVDRKGAVWTAQGGTPAYTAGVYAGSQALGGSPAGSSVLAPSTAQANFGTANVAFEFWFKGTAGVGKAPFMIFSSRDASLAQGIRFFVIADTASPNVGSLQFDAPGISLSLRTSGFNLLDNAWHFVQIIRIAATLFTIRIGSVGDVNTAVFQTGVAVGSFSAAGFVAPTIGQEPTISTYSSLEGLQSFRITTGAVVGSLPILVPTAPWPDFPTAFVLGLAGGLTLGVSVGRGGGRGLPASLQEAGVPGATLAAGDATAAPVGQAAAYARGSAVGAATATAATGGQAGTYARGAALAAGDGRAQPAGVVASWSRGTATADGGQPATASTQGNAAASAAGAPAATGAAAQGATGGVGAYVTGLPIAAADARGAPAGDAATWRMPTLVAEGDADAAPAGRGGVYVQGAAQALAAGAAMPQGLDAQWAPGALDASVPPVLGSGVRWCYPQEDRGAVAAPELRIAEMPSEGRLYRVSR